MMHKTLAVVSLALIVPCALPASRAAAQEPGARRVRYFVPGYQRDRVEQTERSTRTLKLGAEGELDVSNLSGDITVTRAAGNDVTVEIVKRARGRTDEEARRQLGLVTVEIEERGKRAEIRTRYGATQGGFRQRENYSASVDFTIAAPAGTRVTVKTLSGDIKVSDIKGDLALDTMSGNIRINAAARIASAKTVSGDVEIASTTADGPLAIGTMSGSLTIRDVKARRMELVSVSGDVLLRDIGCDQVAVRSVSGNVSFEGALVKSGRYDLNSHSGDIRLMLSGGTGFELEANSFSGEVRSDLPLNLRSREPEGRRGRMRRAIHGTFGDGSAYLDIVTFSGNVTITKR